VVYLFGAGRSRAKNWLCNGTHNKRDTMSLYYFEHSKCKILHPVLGVCIVDEGTDGPRKDARARLILANTQGQWIQSLGRLQYGNLTLVDYNIIPWSSD
jgi:hypothetical protein